MELMESEVSSENNQAQLHEVIKSLQAQLRDKEIELSVITDRFIQELNYSNKLAVDLRKIQQHGV